MGIVVVQSLTLRLSNNPATGVQIRVGALKKDKKFTLTGSKDVTHEALQAVSMLLLMSKEQKANVTLAGKKFELALRQLPEET